jgi:hypothetical protein
MGGEGELEARVVGQEIQVSTKDDMGGERDLEAKLFVSKCKWVGMLEKNLLQM